MHATVTTTWPRKDVSTGGVRHACPWPVLAEQMRATGELVRAKDTLPAILYGTTMDGHRRDEGVRALHALGLDHDAHVGDTPVPMEAAVSWLRARGLAGIVYETPSSTPEAPRWRLVLPLIRPWQDPHRTGWSRAYEAVRRTLEAELGTSLDPANKNPSRFFYPPSRPDETTHPRRVEWIDGQPFSMEAAARAVGWREEPSEPRPPPEASPRRRELYTRYGTRYGLEALEGLRSELANTPKGEPGKPGRDQAAFRVAVRLLGLELAGELPPGSTEAAVRQALEGNGYLSDPRPDRGENGFQRVMTSARKRAKPEPPPPSDHGGTDRRGYTRPGEDPARDPGLAIDDPGPGDSDAPGAGPSNQAAQRERAPDLGVLGGYRRDPPPFPTDLLGPWASWCERAAEGAGAPVDYTAAALLGVAAGTIGNAVRVEPWPGWQEPSVLWLGLVGDPSSGKSPGLDPLTAVLGRLDSRWKEQYDPAHKAWRERCALAEVKLAAWKKAAAKAVANGNDPPPPPDSPPEPPELPRLRVSDTTPEALARVLAGNPRGVLLVRDELVAWLAGFGRYGGSGSGAAASERALWIEVHGARTHIVDRVKGSVRVPHAAVSIVGTTQPSRLDSLLLTGDDDGLASRFLWTWPEPIPPRRPRWSADRDRLERALLHLRELPMGEPQPTVLRLEAPAVETFETWRDEHFRTSRGSMGLVGSALGKAPGQVLRLAMVLELLDTAWITGGPPTMLSHSALLRALALWEDYFYPMALRVYGDAALPEADRDATTLSRWVAQERPPLVNARELRRKERLPGLNKGDRVRAALSGLVEAGWLEPISGRTGGTPGRQREDYRPAPGLYDLLDQRGEQP